MNKVYCENCPNKYKDICEMSTICDSVYNKGVEDSIVDRITELDKSKTYLVECNDSITIDGMERLFSIFKEHGINATFTKYGNINSIKEANYCYISGVVGYDETYAENCIRVNDNSIKDSDVFTSYNADILNTISAISDIDFKYGDTIWIHIIRTIQE